MDGWMGLMDGRDGLGWVGMDGMEVWMDGWDGWMGLMEWVDGIGWTDG